VRFSLGWATTDDDIERVLDVLPSTVERLRMLSPLASSKLAPQIDADTC
jgi:cysteine sulfinate desulfinase/cysteine desulfurase-like protein